LALGRDAVFSLQRGGPELLYVHLWHGCSIERGSANRCILRANSYITNKNSGMELSMRPELAAAGGVGGLRTEYVVVQRRLTHEYCYLIEH
jgi:hypothetical protein